VDSSKITPEEATHLCASIRRSLAYLVKLRRRMEVLGFPPSDSLYAATVHAQQALQDLHVRAHYCSVTSGVGRDL
jgi:hypothetical protein